MQRSLDDFRKHKGRLIAISPLVMENAAALKEKLALTFPMTIDPGNRAAREFGLVYTLADAIKPVYEGFGINIPEANGDDSFELPVPATYIIDVDGIVRLAYINADHTRRLDPEDIIAALENLG
ncbi:MAG: redoxin domain-containing protein [Deltaproteobacteria bacterium]|nr:redoxin domain-containing protein [Deltaproteobacteria bacterium]